MKSAAYKLFFILCLAGFLSCNTEQFDQGDAVFSDSEARVTGQIIGESVSENQSGLISSFAEAFSIPTPSRLEPGPFLLLSDPPPVGANYTYSFNSETGEHTVSYNRVANEPFFSSDVDFTLRYTFYNSAGNLISAPAQQSGEIESVVFVAQRSGFIETDSKSSFFNRTDHLFLGGVSENSDILSIDGFHSGEGLFSGTMPDGTVTEREYFLEMNYLDIQIHKPVVVQNRHFRNGVYGAISYESTTRETASGSPQTQTINGTIEFNGDGTALLKFRELTESFRLRLANGEVFDDDDFEGRVVNVNLSDNIFTISNGQRIQINQDTEIEDGDFNTLTEVAAAVDQGVRVFADGDYFHPDETENLWIATKVEFELESSSFEDFIAATNLQEMSFTLINGDRFYISDASELSFEEGLTSFEEVSDAVDNRIPVFAEGDFFVDPASGRRTVSEAEFKLVLNEFDESVVDVNLTERTFTLENELILFVTDDTVIDQDGDFTSLEEVAEALNSGEELEAEGTWYFNETDNKRIAVYVEFSN